VVARFRDTGRERRQQTKVLVDPTNPSFNLTYVGWRPRATATYLSRQQHNDRNNKG